MSATNYRGGGVKGQAVLNRNHSRHKMSAGVKQRTTPFLGINLIDRACDEFFKGRQMPATAYGLRKFNYGGNAQ